MISLNAYVIPTKNSRNKQNKKRTTLTVSFIVLFINVLPFPKLNRTTNHHSRTIRKPLPPQEHRITRSPVIIPLEPSKPLRERQRTTFHPAHRCFPKKKQKRQRAKEKLKQARTRGLGKSQSR